MPHRELSPATLLRFVLCIGSRSFVSQVGRTQGCESVRLISEPKLEISVSHRWFVLQGSMTYSIFFVVLFCFVLFCFVLFCFVLFCLFFETGFLCVALAVLELTL